MDGKRRNIIHKCGSTAYYTLYTRVLVLEVIAYSDAKAFDQFDVFHHLFLISENLSNLRTALSPNPARCHHEVQRADRKLETNPNSRLRPGVIPAPRADGEEEWNPKFSTKRYKNWRCSGSFSSSSSCCAQVLFFSITPAYP